MNIIFHIDFDSYFVSALRLIEPELENKEVAIGRNIALSLSYEAKNKGAKVGMYRAQINKIVPNIIWRESNFSHFIKISNQIFNYIINKYSSKIQFFSIDECFINVTHLINLNNIKESSCILAKKIQREIKDKFGIPISIGISITSFLAKMSTNLAKPFGIVFTSKQEIEKHFFHLDISKYFGIGKALEQRLRKENINTIGDLFNTFKNLELIKSIFKNTYLNYLNNLKGVENIEQEEFYIPKSISNIKSFDYLAIDNINDILLILDELIASVWIKINNRSMLGKVILLSIKYEGNKKFIQKQFKNKVYIENENELRRIGHSLFKDYWKNKPIKGIGFGVGELQYKNDIYFQRSIFEHNQTKFQENIIIKNTNKIIGNKTLFKASDLTQNKSLKNPKLKFLSEDENLFFAKDKNK